MKEQPKMTIYEYEERYTKRENTKTMRCYLFLGVVAVAVVILTCLFMVSMRVYDLHPIAGYVAMGVSALLFVLLFVVPVVKIFKRESFQVNVNSQTARAAQKHNRQLRHKIADKIIEFNSTVDGVSWYSDQKVGELACAVHNHDEEGIKSALSALYGDSIKKTGRDIITKASLKSGMYSALSQTNKVDSALVAVVNLQMIKDIIYLYGFRPTDGKLAKIFVRVVKNSLVAYGLGGVHLGNTVVKTMGDMAKGIPLLGSAISVLVDSSVQGLTNATLTAVIGYQTIRYLQQEYHLQDLLDNVVIDTEEELEETKKTVEEELKKVNKKAKAFA